MHDLGQESFNWAILLKWKPLRLFLYSDLNSKLGREERKDLRCFLGGVISKISVLTTPEKKINEICGWINDEHEVLSLGKKSNKWYTVK